MDNTRKDTKKKEEKKRIPPRRGQVMERIVAEYKETLTGSIRGGGSGYKGNDDHENGGYCAAPGHDFQPA